MRSSASVAEIAPIRIVNILGAATKFRVQEYDGGKRERKDDIRTCRIEIALILHGLDDVSYSAGTHDSLRRESVGFRSIVMSGLLGGAVRKGAAEEEAAIFIGELQQ
jgi:hypothetical protein